MTPAARRAEPARFLNNSRGVVTQGGALEELHPIVPVGACATSQQLRKC
jgi:hypothetical protein